MLISLSAFSIRVALLIEPTLIALLCIGSPMKVKYLRQIDSGTCGAGYEIENLGPAANASRYTKFRDHFLKERLDIARMYGVRLGAVEVDEFHPCGTCVFVEGAWAGDLDDGSALDEFDSE